MRSLGCLALVSQALGDPAGAVRQVSEALRLAAKMKALSLILACLVHFARILAGKDPPEAAFAAQVAAFVLQHPGAWQETRLRAERLLAGLQAGTPAGVFQAAAAGGQPASLDEILEKCYRYG